MLKEELINFEEEIKQLFIDKKIMSPVHLSTGSEEPLIEIFKQIRKDDWVFSTHRSHYHALLKGVGKEWLRNEILENRSMHIFSKEHKIFTSAIVGGVLPIATGVAMALKRKGSKNRVWVFIGDMGAEMGVFHECTKYSERNNLPITFVVEDNELSVNSPTQKIWGSKPGFTIGRRLWCEESQRVLISNLANPKIIRYKYQRKYPHQGVGVWVSF